MWEGTECFHKQGNRFSLSKPIQFWEERRKKQISLLSDELTECWVCVRLVPWCRGGRFAELLTLLRGLEETLRLPPGKTYMKVEVLTSTWWRFQAGLCDLVTSHKPSRAGPGWSSAEKSRETQTLQKGVMTIH